MDRITAGTMIVISALAVDGGTMRPAQAEDLSRVIASSASAQVPAASGSRSERVLSLVMALEALRAAPDVLTRR